MPRDEEPHVAGAKRDERVAPGGAVVAGRTLRAWADDAVQRVVAATGAETVVLFGSIALGAETATSDIDLLVVVADDVDVHQAGIAALRAVASLPVDVDVVVVTRRSLEANRDKPGTVIRPALRDGKVVYRRAA